MTPEFEAIFQNICLNFCMKTTADFTGLPYFSKFLSGLKSHGLISHDYLSQSALLPLPRCGEVVLEASIKIQKEILFCKQTGLYILHAKWGIAVRGTYSAVLYDFFLPQKPILLIFMWLFTGWRVTYWVSIYVNISPFEKWLKILSKTSLVMWHRAIKSV